MTARFRYKCLNPDCTGSGRRDCTGLFSALDNPTPECPACGSVKLENWGEHIGRDGWILTSPASYGSPGMARGVDASLRHIADAHGLTNMRNDGGKSVGQHRMEERQREQQAASPGVYGHKNYFGVNVPIDGTCKTVAVPNPTGKPMKLPAGTSSIPGRRSVPGAMTQTVASAQV